MSAELQESVVLGRMRAENHRAFADLVLANEIAVKNGWDTVSYYISKAMAELCARDEELKEEQGAHDG